MKLIKILRSKKMKESNTKKQQQIRMEKKQNK